MDTVGVTQVHYQQRRIIVEPDPTTGEFCVDLFPVRYKLTQATATGYATLFNSDRTCETIDLGSVASEHDTVRNGGNGNNGHYVVSNAQYKLTYRSPISITCVQMLYGMELPYFGDLFMQRNNIQNEKIRVPLAYKDSNNVYQYLFGAPVFSPGEYSFRAFAHEDYYYNNESTGRHDEVRIKGGTLKIYNGMHENERRNTQIITKTLDTLGSADFTIPIDYVSFTRSDTNVQRVLDLSVESEGEYVELQAVRGYVTGHHVTGSEAITSTHGEIKLLDVLRDPPGSGSSANIEAGTEYTYSYSFGTDFKFGAEIGLEMGTSQSMTIGAYMGVGSGMFTGQDFHVGSTHQLTLPISSAVHHKQESSYTFKTTERISTSSNPYWVGQPADVYIGLVQNVYARRTDAVQPIDSLTYATLGARSATGLMATIAQGLAPDSTRYYLVIGKELEVRPAIQSTFVYTHDYIENSLVPRLIQERDAMLLTCDSATAKSIANARHQVVFRSLVPVGDSLWADTGQYEAVFPTGFDGVYVNSVDSANCVIADWLTLLMRNEAEKVSAIHYHGHDSVATYSLCYATQVTLSNNYSYSNVTHAYMDYPGMNLTSLSRGILASFTQKFGSALAGKMFQNFNNTRANSTNDYGRESPARLAQQTPGFKTEFIFKPILDVEFSRDPAEKTVHSRTAGFSLVPDEMSNMDVSVYRIVNSKHDFNTGSAAVRDFVSGETEYSGDDNLYGSFVFYLRGGATKCLCELPDSTDYYVPKMPISAGSLRLEKPMIDINVHERSNVPADRPAVFTLTLYNELEQTTGIAGSMTISFKLKMNDQSNPHGARIYIDGMPLTDGRTITFTGNQVITKTMEVYAGDGYDFEDLIIELGSNCNAPNKARAQFSVHFMPVSCDVKLTVPRDNWVLNTLSPEDSVGYYLPVTISDFDVNYRGFDHIELQYKLSTHSDDGWVTLCSWYADSARYNAASGTKAMIQGGSIDNIRFYGERDPMEQQYDLRAVSFCRHGSGFISRSSEIKTGVKDTRRPRVFGQPLPANGILGVGDYLKLRFNEPIAGNYLDEDNNFQILGSTNSSGISSSTSIFFDGTSGCGAMSAVTRVLDSKSFSVDLMVKPSPITSFSSQELFGHSTPTGGVSFGLKPENNTSDLRFRLYANIDDYYVQSLPLEPMTDFTRVIMTYDNITGRIRFYAGTLEVTDPEADTSGADNYSGEAPLVFGHGYRGNMLEARLWFKALTPAEIELTNRKRLTGFERKLAAYYPMNEGRGETMQDIANGSTLTLHGSSWTTPSGLSLHLDGRTVVELDQNILNLSSIQDYTLMFWFRTNEYNAGLYSTGWDGTRGTLIALENGQLAFHNGSMVQRSSRSYADGLWHHYVISVNRTYNNASIYVDGSLVNTFAADGLSGLNGETFLGGVKDTVHGVPPFAGHFDGVALFEQALPRSLIEMFDNISPMGDELGLIAYLPFSEQHENENSIMEEVFSINNCRVVKRNGEVLDIEQPLVLSPSKEYLATMADGNVRAPIRERDLMTRMNFDWSFNNDELLINLNMADHEINKNLIYVTVRNVEDLNGNSTASPITWQAFVNKNSLLWESEDIDEVFYYSADNTPQNIPVRIRNYSGRRHQFKIEGLPEWLSVDRPIGSIDPQESLTLNFSIDSRTLAVGDYSELIYLTDDEDLSEPLKVHIVMKDTCPWSGVDPSQFDRQMSLRAQVKIDGRYVTNPEDVIVAIADDIMVGYANVSPDLSGGGSYIYMNIYGNEQTEGKQLKFRAWLSSSGRIFNLTSDDIVTFQADSMVGLPPSPVLLLYSTSTAVQYFNLHSGWNWVSLNIAPDAEGALGDLFFMEKPFHEGDQIKEAYSRRFAEWDGTRWRGTLTKWDYKHVYMIYSNNEHLNVQVTGQRLVTSQQRTITLKHNWNSLPYLQMTPTSVTEALSDYVDHATVGDLVKSQDAFAVFSENQRWEGSLTAMHPGKGYLMKRLANNSVTFTYHGAKGGKGSHAPTNSPNEARSVTELSTMTMIATTQQPVDRVLTYLDGKLVATTEPIDSLFFITIPADQTGLLSFALESNGEILGTTQALFQSQPDAHYGSLKQPVLLSLGTPSQSITAYPTLFTDHVDFNGLPEKAVIRLYNATGVLLGQYTTQNPETRIQNLENLPSGIYFTTINDSNNATTIKLIKK